MHFAILERIKRLQNEGKSNRISPMTRGSCKGNGVKTDTILNCIADGVFTVDLEWRITSFNRAAEQIQNLMAFMLGMCFRAW